MRMLIAVLFLALAFSARATTLNVAIDLSGSNPLLSHENFAFIAAKYVSERIEKLKMGDRVHLQTFGARGDPRNFLDQIYVIKRRQRPAAVAATVAKFIRSLPSQKGLSQGATNIVAWIEFHDGFACNAGDQILLLSDGIESSAYVDARAFVEGKAGLPEPEVALSGCTLTFYGLGAGMPPQMVKNVRNAWRTWAKSSGAQFNAIIR